MKVVIPIIIVALFSIIIIFIMIIAITFHCV